MASETPFRTSIDVVRRWHALAERRRKHYVELYRSDRWRRYFTEEVFLLRMRDVIANVEEWQKILDGMERPRNSEHPEEARAA